MELHISPRSKPYFDRAGFQLPRRVAVHPDVSRDHPAFLLLERFGGIHVGIGPDEKMLKDIRNDIVFGYTDRYGYVDEWERLLGATLIGVAETHHRHGLLYVANDERFFTLSGMHDAMGFEGRGFSNAIDNLLFAQSVPMIRPDQKSVRWYGIEYGPNDAGLYRYDAP